MVNSFAELIDRWPSKAEFGSDIGVVVQQAYNMHARNSIPVDYWSKAIAAAKVRGIDGVDWDLLDKLRRARFPEIVKAGRK